ncbi:bifunctional DNA primase/polymerase [Dactylosporangium sp. NPDC005572]|uniref:bifunctional DNA primase/polymerase n=1 Tax=Dactylosporangium sp. NPDC005572 TaxID=3156889 RepID=UPI0033B76B5B
MLTVPTTQITAADLLGAALQYAAASIAVVPLHTPDSGGQCSCRGRTDCGSPGKHPRLQHGLHDATTEPDRIRRWWRRWPDANVGVATGTRLDVCDIDTNDGLRAILDLLDIVRPAGPLVRSGYGWHLWFAATGLGNRAGLLPGVDWRGRGGYAVAPPSLHPTGRRYTFQQPFTGPADLPTCPDAVRRLVVAPPPPSPELSAGDGQISDLDRYTQAALEGEVSRILAAPRPVIRGGQRLSAGGRNTALHLAAFRLGQLAARGGIDQHTVWSRLTDAARTVGLGQTETQRTIASGWRAGLRRPRS